MFNFSIIECKLIFMVIDRNYVFTVINFVEIFFFFTEDHYFLVVLKASLQKLCRGFKLVTCLYSLQIPVFNQAHVLELDYKWSHNLPFLNTVTLLLIIIESAMFQNPSWKVVISLTQLNFTI